MFDYCVSKQPHFDDACIQFAKRHNMAELAKRAGMNVQTLRNKLNPEQPYQLTPPEFWVLTDLTEDSTLVDGFLAQIHCLPCVPVNELAREKLPVYVMQATAEVGQITYLNSRLNIRRLQGQFAKPILQETSLKKM